MRKHKNGKLGLLILDYLNDTMILIAKYAASNYKKHSLFFMEAFLVEASSIAKEIIKENQGKNFFVECRLIKEMTNRLVSKKIETRWINLLGGVTWTP